MEEAPRQKLNVTVEAAGFSRYKAELSERADELAVVLLPAAVAQEINVTANRVGDSQEDTPESIEAVSSRKTDAIASLPGCSPCAYVRGPHLKLIRDLLLISLDLSDYRVMN